MNRIILASLGLVALASPVLAADLGPGRMPAKAPIVAAPVVFNWTGFYVGAHLGWGSAEKDASWIATQLGPVVGAPLIGSDSDGFLGGLQAGFNWQFGQWVFGVEGQVSWTDLDGSASLVPWGFAPGALIHHNVDFAATLAARFGVAFDRALVYVKGGAAWADDEYWYSLNGVPMTNVAGDTRAGWMVGIGLEYAFAPNWSAKIEYNFMDFGGDDHRFYPIGGAGIFQRVHIDQEMHVVKFGVNYRFGFAAPPVAARY